MVDTSFAEFARNNLELLDELAKSYMDYKWDVVNKFCSELRSELRKHVPDGYVFFDQNAVLDEPKEFWCGWRSISKLPITAGEVTICFAFSMDIDRILYDWPMKNDTCWTGISTWFSNAQSRDKFSKCARDLAVDTEARDNNWILWKAWEPFANATLNGLHEQLIGSTRVDSQHEIIAQLLWWKQALDRINEVYMRD